MTQSPVEVWLALRDMPELSQLDDGALWDAVAYLWRQNTTAGALALGQKLYSQNCAACHGEGGDGDGVFAQTGVGETVAMRGHDLEAASAFTDPALLAASNALLQGKIMRGGMGTGMPAWGAIFSEEELQALLDYLWTFQFAEDGGA
jgi:mono/diheme cytochrome c family protein